MEKRLPLNVAVLELISSILGDTNKGLTGTEIHRFLLQAGIKDISEQETFLSKRKKLFNGSNIIVVFLTIQYYCLSLRHE